MIPKLNFLSTVLLITAVLTSTVFYFLKETEKKEKLRVQQMLAETTSAKEKLETDIQELRLSTASLEEKVKSQDEIIAAVRQDIEEEQNRRRRAEGEVLVRQSEMENLRNRAQKAEDEKRELQSRLEKQYEDYFNMKSQLSSLLKTKEELEAKAKELAESGPVSLGTVIIRRNT